MTTSATTNRPVTVISHTGRVLHRHIHATPLACGGLPVVSVDGALFVLGPVKRS